MLSALDGELTISPLCKIPLVSVCNTWPNGMEPPVLCYAVDESWRKLGFNLKNSIFSKLFVHFENSIIDILFKLASNKKLYKTPSYIVIYFDINMDWLHMLIYIIRN